MNWKQYFAMMTDWKKLPAYKAEPRIDSIIGYYLKDILSDLLKVSIVDIIPELPIRLGTVYSDKNIDHPNRSFKVDFYAVDTDGMNYLVEFKTDNKSRCDKQDKYLDRAKKIKMKSLIDGIVEISNVTATNYVQKYKHLKNKLLQLGIIDETDQFVGKSELIRIVYVQPMHDSKVEHCIDFNKIADWLRKKYPDQEFEKEISETLHKWISPTINC